MSTKQHRAAVGWTPPSAPDPWSGPANPREPEPDAGVGCGPGRPPHLPVTLASQRSNVLIATLPGTEMEGLASHLLLKGSGRCDVSSTDRIFLKLTSERDLLGGPRAGPWSMGTGVHHLRDSFQDNPDDALQHGDHHHCEKKIEDSAKHRLFLFYPRKPLFFFVGRFAGRVDAGLRVAGGDERRRDVDAQCGINHGILRMLQILLGFRDVDLM